MSRHKHHKQRRLHGGRPQAKPGSLPVLSPVDPLFTPTQIRVIGYNENGAEEKFCSGIDDIQNFAKQWRVTWVNIDGLGNTDLILELGNKTGLDRLVLEDIFDVSHLPKIEEFNDYIFMILKEGSYDKCFESEHICLVLMDNIVISFQEKPGDNFDQIRKRILTGSGKIRKFGPSFLAYALIDAIIEGYYPILNTLKTKLEHVEDYFIQNEAKGDGEFLIREVHAVKSDLLFLHSSVWPIYDIVINLAQNDTNFVEPELEHYLRDCQDQAKQVKDLSEFYRMIAGDLMNTYLAFNDFKANEVMKVLTMVTTIFIPLSFIVGVYGMNFDNMPELHSRYGYPLVWAVMIGIVMFILLMFRKMGWIGQRRRHKKMREE